MRTSAQAPAPLEAPTGVAPLPGGVWRGSLALGVGRVVGTAATALELIVAARTLEPQAFGRWTYLLTALLVVEALADLGTGAAALQRGAADARAFAGALRAARRARRLTAPMAAGALVALGLAVDAHPGWLVLAAVLPLSRLPETSSLAFQRSLDWTPIVGTRAVGAAARAVLVPALLLGGVRDVGALLAAHAGGLALGNALVHVAARRRGRLPDLAPALPARSLWALAAPLGAAALVHQLALYLDNGVLLALRGPTELGAYNAAGRVASFVLLFGVGAGVVVLPWLASRDGAALGEAASRLGQVLVVPAAIVLGLLTPYADEVLATLFGASFAAAAPALRILLVSALVVHATAGWLTAVVAAGAGRAVLGWTGAALALNLFGNLALVPSLGATGAASATLATELLLSTGAWRTLRRRGAAPPIPLPLWVTAAVVFLASAGGGHLARLLFG